MQPMVDGHLPPDKRRPDNCPLGQTSPSLPLNVAYLNNVTKVTLASLKSLKAFVPGAKFYDFITLIYKLIGLIANWFMQSNRMH